MSSGGKGCSTIIVFGVLGIWLLYTILESLLTSKSEQMNFIGVLIIIFIIGWLFWFLNKTPNKD